MVQYDAGHSGYNPDATVPENVTTRWRYTACTGIDGIVTVADGSVVPGRAVLNGRTGERSAGELTSYQRPAVVDGTLFVGSHALEAYDPADLTPRWTFETEGDSGGVSAPTVADGTVYVAGNVDDRTVYAVDAADGSERWRFTPNHEHNTPVAVDGDSVYLVDHAGVLYCLDAASGTERWRYRGGNETFYRPPIAVDGQVYVALDDGAVVAVAGADGAERWRTDTADRGEVALAVAEDTVYVGASDACLALDRADGTERWRADCVSGGACSVASNAVVFGGDETLTALSRTDGSELWSFETRSVAIYNSPLSGIPFAPALVDNSVFVATEGSDIYALGSAAD